MKKAFSVAVAYSIIVVFAACVTVSLVASTVAFVRWIL